MPLKSFIVNYIFKEITCLSVLEWNFQNDMTNYIKKLRLFYSRSFFVVSMIIRIIFEKYIKFYNSFWKSRNSVINLWLFILFSENNDIFYRKKWCKFTFSTLKLNLLVLIRITFLLVNLSIIKIIYFFNIFFYNKRVVSEEIWTLIIVQKGGWPWSHVLVEQLN